MGDLLQEVGDPFAEGSRRLSRLLTPKRLAIQFAVVNLIHCRLSPTRPFSERSPTYKRLPTSCKRLPTSFDFSCV
ncbi:MAG: hypothetical protein LBL62_00215 [Planctomycetaceae bacterium]|nr:hypothetical protein [Planctomycetaceae bacterium]